MLREKPDIDGLAVPGMPSGSLGTGDHPGASYDVFAIPRRAGTTLRLSVGPPDEDVADFSSGRISGAARIFVLPASVLTHFCGGRSPTMLRLCYSL
jgi:hypothetical protein